MAHLNIIPPNQECLYKKYISQKFSHIYKSKNDGRITQLKDGSREEKYDIAYLRFGVPTFQTPSDNKAHDPGKPKCNSLCLNVY